MTIGPDGKVTRTIENTATTACLHGFRMPARRVLHATVRCPRCGTAGTEAYSLHGRRYELRFTASFKCNNCSYGLEADGSEVPDDVRALFYEAEGRWTATVRSLGPRRVEALRVLRALLGATPAEILRLLQEGRPVAEGTLAEVEAAQELLAEAGAEVSVDRQA